MTEDYVGRTVDVLLWQLTGSGFLTDSKGLASVVTGIYKLAQRFILTLLTIKDSPTYTLGRPLLGGTCLLAELRGGHIHNEADMLAVFALAELEARSQLQSEEASTDPTDERYKKSTLSSLTILPGHISLTIQTTSLAGSTAEVIVPIPLTV